jgi:hypothetical protein
LKVNQSYGRQCPLYARKQTSAALLGMSVTCQFPTYAAHQKHRYSITSSARASTTGGTVTVDRLSSFKVDDQLELGRLLDRNVGRFRPAQNLVGELSGAGSIGRQTVVKPRP